MVFFVTHYKIESRTLKKQNRNNTDAFECWCCTTCKGKRSEWCLKNYGHQQRNTGVLISCLATRGVAAAALELAVSMRLVDVGGAVFWSGSSFQNLICGSSFLVVVKSAGNGLFFKKHQLVTQVCLVDRTTKGSFLRLLWIDSKDGRKQKYTTSSQVNELNYRETLKVPSQDPGEGPYVDVKELTE